MSGCRERSAFPEHSEQKIEKEEGVKKDEAGKERKRQI